jgi:hypothetical protein
MGCEHYTYVGPYFKVWPPKIETNFPMQTCSNTECCGHGIYSSSNFCNRCGSEVKQVPVKRIQKKCMHEFMEEELNNEDLFNEITLEYSEEHKDCVLLTSNYNGQGGITFDQCYSGETDMPPTDLTLFEKGDWKKMSDALERKDVKFEKKIGIINYFH